MAGSLNRVELIGNVGKDPEIRHTQDGRPIANLSIATSESWRDKQTGEKREKTEWHRVVCFSESLCKVIEQYVSKGSKIFVSGQLQTRKWTDKDGVDRYSTEVVMQGFQSQLILLSAAKNGGGADDRGSDRDDDGREPERSTRGGGMARVKTTWTMKFPLVQSSDNATQDV